MTTQSADPTPREIIGSLRAVRNLDGVTGVVVATTDGRTVATDLDETTPGAAAAITASSLGLGSRLGELTEPNASLHELQVRSSAGYVCLYVINPGCLLGVMTTHAVNLARLKLEMRDVLQNLDAMLTPELLLNGHRPPPA